MIIETLYRSSGAKLACSLVLMLFLSGCATIKSGSHHDESISFDHYQTFSWIADPPLIVGTGERPSVSPLTQKMIADAIRNELTRKGFTYSADPETADFVLSFTVGTRDRIEATSYPVDYRIRGAWGWHLHGPAYVGVQVEHRMYTEGTLGVDVFDGTTKQPVWHGWATKTISTSDRQDPAPSIDKAVSALFAEFPPSRAEDL